MRSMRNWKVLLGVSTALTIVLFSSIILQLNSTRNQAQAIVNDLIMASQAAEATNDKLQFLLDSITRKSAQLEARVSFLEAQKDSLTRGTARPHVASNAVSTTSNFEQNLYMNCENLVQIDIPKRHASAKLKYSSEDARIIETETVGKFIMFPMRRNVLVSVESGGSVIYRREFLIKNVPDPVYAVYRDSQKIDLKRGIEARLLSSLKVVAEPEPNFKRSVPKDARYRTKRWELDVTRGSSTILRRVCNSERLDLTTERALWKPGDIVRITEMRFGRLAHDNREDLIIHPAEITFPIL